MPRELPLFKAFLIFALGMASVALVWLGPSSHAGQMDVFANPVVAQAQAGTEQDPRRVASPGIEGDHPGSLSTQGPSSANPVESSAARPDTEGSARRDAPGSAKRDTMGDARRDTPGSARRDTPGDAKR